MDSYCSFVVQVQDSIVYFCDKWLNECIFMRKSIQLQDPEYFLSPLAFKFPGYDRKQTK